MAKLEIKALPTRKKILPLAMTLANLLIKKLGFVEKINEAVKWDKAYWNVSPGSLCKMMILSSFGDIRTPLTHLDDRLENIDIEYFLEPEDKVAAVNSYNVGEALERLGDADYNGLYETLALSAVQMHEIPMERLHADTTTVSFYGEYDVDKMKLSEKEEAELLKIERGYNKDGRPLDNQVVVGQIVNEFGIPVISRTMDGSTSDVEWNGEAIKYFRELQKAGFRKGIYVADSKLVTQEHVSTMNSKEGRVNFVSRCPANFECKLESRMIQKAYEAKEWDNLGSFQEKNNASTYKGISFIETVCGAPMRLLVLESSFLAQKAEQQLVKKEKEIPGLFKKIEAKTFRCSPDAENELEQFLKTKDLELFDIHTEIEKRTKEKWPRGRRGKNTEPICVDTWHINIRQWKRSDSACTDFMRRESCFVIISNVIDEMSNQDLLKTYKGQQVVENSFRLLKSPQLASVIYLKKPKRIQALTMLLTFSLLIRAIIQYKLREGLRTFEEEHPGEELRVGWGNKPLKNPTFKLFYEHAINCCFEREAWGSYSFAWISVETRDRVSTLLALMGVELKSLLQ